MSSSVDTLTLRAMKEEDIDRIRRIHRAYYKDEFDFPDFEKFFLNALVIEDNGAIVTAGGLRVITEAVALTNKDFSPRERKLALEKLLTGLAYTAHRDGFDQIHAFVQDENWKKVLLHRNFNFTKGDALVYTLT